MSQEMLPLFHYLRANANNPGDLLEALQRIAKAAQEHFRADFCVIFPMNPVTQTFLREQPTITGRISRRTRKEFKIPREAGLASLVLSKKILLADKDQLPRYKTPITEIEKVQSLAAFGLFTNSHRRPLAVVYLDYKKSKKFDRAYQNKLQAFIEIASSELQTTWFLRRYREITRIGEEINENLENMDRLFGRVYEHIKGILDVSYYFSMINYDLRRNNADLFLVDEGNMKIKKNFALTNSVSSWVLRNLQTKVFGNLDQDLLPDGTRAVHIDGTASREKSAIFVPIKLVDRPLGVLSVQHPKTRYFDDEDRQILELLANHIALALNNHRLLEELKEIDRSGQTLTEKLDSGEDIVEEVVERIYQTTRADLITLYPYLQSENKYARPLRKGDFIDVHSIMEGESSPAAIVHLINLRDDPIFAEDSKTVYANLGKDYQSGGRFPDREKIKSTAVLPLRAGSERIGVLFINYRAKQQFDLAQKWVISSLARYAAIAMRNTRQIRDLRLRRLKELEDLREIDKAISRTLEYNTILQVILERTTNHIKADTGVILLLNLKKNAIEARAAVGEYNLPLEQQSYPLDQFKGIAKTAFEMKRTIRIDNVREDAEWRDKFIEISKTTLSEMDVPLILENEAIGVMNFESKRQNAFTADDQGFVETLAGQAVIAIRNAMEYERTQRIAKEREALIAIVNTLLSHTDQKEIFSIILNKALEVTETDKGTINTCDDIRREIRVVVDKGLKPEFKNGVQTFDQGVIGRAVREKRVIRIDRLSVDPLRGEFFDAFQGEEESELAVPILEGDKVIGVINLESENPYHFESDDVDLIESLASLCAVAIKNAQSINEKQLASVGIITGDLSHKMKSPLAKIKSNIELIEMNCGEEVQKNPYLADKLNQITMITSNTIQMVYDRLSQAKRNFTNVERTSVLLMLKKALSEVEIPAGINLENSLKDYSQPLDVLATPELSNVFQNLLTNAVRAIPSSRGSIRIHLDRLDGEWVVLSVEDTGIGIQENIAPLAFLPISDKGAEGHGLGLPMIRAYLQMIGGKIDNPVKGRDGLGAKFSIHLKRA